MIDRESRYRLKVQPAQIKDYYRQTIQKFNTDLKLKCGQYKIDLVEADIAAGFDHILKEYLAKRAKMR